MYIFFIGKYSFFFSKKAFKIKKLSLAKYETTHKRKINILCQHLPYNITF